MEHKVDAIQSEDGTIQTVDEITFRLSYDELTQALTHIKTNISTCISDLEHAAPVEQSILHSMKNAMEDVEHIRTAILQMNHFILKNTVSYDNIKIQNNDTNTTILEDIDNEQSI